MEGFDHRLECGQGGAAHTRRDDMSASEGHVYIKSLTGSCL